MATVFQPLNAVFAGASTNTSGTNTSTSLTTGTQSQTPNIPKWYSDFLSGLPGQFKSLQAGLSGQAGRPLYGAPQEAAFRQGVNQNLNQTAQTLNSQLAASGGYNSGRADRSRENLAIAGQGQINDYLAKVPALNAQNSQALTAQQLQLLGQQGNFSLPISAFGTTQTGSNQVNNYGMNTGEGQLTPNILGAILSSFLGNLPGAIGGLATGSQLPDWVKILLGGKLGNTAPGAGGGGVDPTLTGGAPPIQVKK